jgi:hypothetical protein
MRYLVALAMLGILAGCGTEKSSGEVVPDAPHAKSVDEVATATTPTSTPASYNPADIPPCLSIYEGATGVRAERQQTEYGGHYSLGYMVDAPLQDVVGFYMRAVREKGCLIDQIDSRDGIAQFTIYTEQSVNSGKSSSLEIVAINNGAGPISVSSRGHWLNP